MKQGIVEAFKSLLSDTREWRANLEGLNFQRINEVEVERLETPFTVDEVFTALSNFNGDKAPGPDGLTLAFWKFSWDIVKDDIMRMFKEFFETGKLVKNLNTTFWCLCRKKEGLRISRTLDQYVWWEVYKLLVKVLENRLKRVMHEPINRAQNAFVEG